MTLYILLGLTLVSILITIYFFAHYQKVKKLEDPVARSKTASLFKISTALSGLLAVFTLLYWFVF